MEIDIDKLPGQRSDELGRILRYWAGAARDLDLATASEHPLMDSGYHEVGVLRLS